MIYIYKYWTHKHPKNGHLREPFGESCCCWSMRSRPMKTMSTAVELGLAAVMASALELALARIVS